jgi:Alternative oxidase
VNLLRRLPWSVPGLTPHGAPSGGLIRGGGRGQLYRRSGEVDAGRAADVEAPEIARRYWNLPADATLRDVVLVVRANEAHHRAVNRSFASELADKPVDPQMLASQPWYADVTDRRA